jgi:N-methylhydantoinase A/oxoprolinase/acetone carboxylase beta subunit
MNITPSRQRQLRIAQLAFAGAAAVALFGVSHATQSDSVRLASFSAPMSPAGGFATDSNDDQQAQIQQQINQQMLQQSMQQAEEQNEAAQQQAQLAEQQAQIDAQIANNP